MRHSRGLLVFAIGLVGACKEQPPPEPEVEEGVELRATQLWSSSPGLLLSRISSIAVDSRGRVYAWDVDAGILVLGPEGDSLRTIGRKGEGPGEYQSAGRLQILPGDSLLAHDYQLRRVTVFAPDADVVAYTHRIAESSGTSGPTEVIRVHEPAGYLAMHTPFYSSAGEPAEEMERKPVFRLHAFDGSIVRDSVLTLEAGEEIVLRRSSGGVTALMVGGSPFSPRNVFDLSDEGFIVHGWTDSLMIEIHDLEGRLVGGFSAPSERLPVTAEEVDRLLARFSENPMARDWGDEYAGAVRETVPETWPAFQDLLVDDHGRIWIRASTREGKPRKWTVFERSGEQVGRVELPFGLEAVHEDVAYGVEYDEFDVPTIVAYRIEGLERSE